MLEQARPERKTQNRIIDLFTNTSHPDCLGYEYLGEWQKKENNRCVEKDLLKKNLKKRGYSELAISASIQKLFLAVDVTGTTLYQSNLNVYQYLRYGISVQTAVGKKNEQVHLIDWSNYEKNDFALAEEVTLRGGYERRPDIVLYINGIAISVIELKRSSVDVADGIRQLRTNQEKIFNESFFSSLPISNENDFSQQTGISIFLVVSDCELSISIFSIIFFNFLKLIF